MPEISTDKPITAAQVRAIHVALHRRGIDDDEYRGRLMDRWGVETCKALTRRQASDLLHSLSVPLRNPPGEPRRERAPRPDPLPDNVARLPTRAQRELIAELSAELRWREEDGLERWLRRNLGLDAIRTSADAARAIEGLKAMARRRAG